MRTITVEHADYQCTMRVEGGDDDDGNGGKDWEYPRKIQRPTPRAEELEAYAPSCSFVPAIRTLPAAGGLRPELRGRPRLKNTRRFLAGVLK